MTIERQFATGLTASVVLIGLPALAHAGMPSVNLTDLGRMRLSALSFFAVGFLVSAWGIQRLWNRLQRDFPKLPRLTFSAAAGVVFLWGMLFVLVLTMVSGARELMTPGAWERQGLTYKLSSADDAVVEPTPDENLLRSRKQRLQKLHAALLRYAARHEGRYPSDVEADAIDPEAWMLPDRLGVRYIYSPGRSAKDIANVVAYEPQVYEDPQLVLWTDGRVQPMSGAELADRLKAGDTR